jgi:23S rRNA (uracil-5-)-methyltransferase RumA
VLRSSTGESLVIETTGRSMFVEGPEILHEEALGRGFEVTGSGFWQVHPGAADVLVSAVLEALGPQPGERVLDLYAGVGLFAIALAGRAPSVRGVEIDPLAVEDAVHNAARAGAAHVRIETGDVRQGLASWRRQPGERVILDPPRTGAGAEVVRAVAGRKPETVVYVSCDPPTLGRDLRVFAAEGYRLDRLAGFDMFPDTHHLEAVAVLVPV